ncbi:NACHT domain-containing protein [Actinocorallia populi]|uniref:NACHT domain-containing protein n=1 Tax=Actinocorallia populi TaxID=2079200 RepID=UPI001300A619|nr:NACHT domain-containing protein [Actinocorallia populi]
MGAGRQVWVLWAAVLLVGVATVAVGARSWPWEKGDVDPAAISVGLTTLVSAVVVARWQVGRSERLTPVDTGKWADHLAKAVYAAETRQRQQLLAGHPEPIDLEFVFTPAPAHDAIGADPAGTLSGIADYFDRLKPQRLVITGEPGSGKTVTAIQLILLLLDPARRQPGGPVPVRVSAAGWNPAGGVHAWLARRLVADYKMHPRNARLLVDAGLILPVIDGLDEMDHADTSASHAAEALRALNDYQHGTGRARIVVTCRTGRYDALSDAKAFAQGAARIALQPLNAAQAEDFLDDIVVGTDRPRWQPVLEALTQPGHPLAQALSTPWRFTLATTVYTRHDRDAGDRDPRDLLALSDAAQVSDHLLARYIPATCKTAPGRYDPDQVHRYLARLARYLNDNTTRPPLYGRTLSSTDLILYELWPLAGWLPRYLVTGLILLLPLWFFVGAILGDPYLADNPWMLWLSPVVAAALAAAIWEADPWPEPSRLDWSRLATREGLRALAFDFGVGLAGGLAPGFVWAIFAGWTALVLTVACGISYGLMKGLVSGLWEPGDGSGVNPRELIRNDFLGWFTLGLMGGLAFGLTLGLAFGPRSGLVNGLSAAFLLWFLSVIGFETRITGGAATTRYLMLLLCTRGRLPWRLSRFLHWCYQAGLVRISGVAYQFRHHELQDYLASHPLPLITPPQQPVA